MSSFKHLVVTAAIVALATTESFAIDVTSTRIFQLLHNNNNSPFFATSADAANTFQPVDFSNAVFTPAGSPRAGEVSSLTTNGVFTIIGNSTSAGGWSDGNGVPAGITLTFNAAITFSVNPASPAGSYLTLVNNGSNRGNGLGITQVFQGASNIESVNQLSDGPGAAHESLDVSAVSVTDVSFAGSLAEPGFNFTPGTVGNFGPIVIRSGGNTASGVEESAETFGLVSETGPAPQPGDEGLPHIGFGRPTIQSEIDQRRGEGIVASHVASENDFAEVFVGGDSTHFPRQIGAWTLTPQNGRIGIKGIGYEYDVTFDISSIGAGLDGDFNGDEVVDSLDYVVWRMGFNGNPPAEEDFELWAANYGNTANGSGTAAGSAVPEPATAGLVLLGLLVLGAARRAKR